MSTLKDFSLVEVSLKAAVTLCVRVCVMSRCQRVIGKGHPQARRQAGTLMTMIVSDLRCVPRVSLSSSTLSILPE